MTVRFDNRVAVVTGSGAGLGRAHALLLASRGAKLVVNDPGVSIDGKGGKNSVADEVVTEIKSAGGEAVANYASVAEREGAEDIVKTAIDTFGRIDIIVNNAGFLRDKSFTKMTLDDFELVLGVHLMGSVYVTKAAWPHLLGQSYGRVVFTSSSSGLSGNFGQANYGAAKAGMVGLMNNLKNEGLKYNVRVNTIAPVAATRMTEGQIPDEMFKLLRPELVSPAVAWLCSDDCDVTGEIISAGAGYFSRVKMMKTKGIVINPRGDVSIEEFVQARSRIFDLGKMVSYGSTIDEDTKKILGISPPEK